MFTIIFMMVRFFSTSEVVSMIDPATNGAIYTNSSGDQ